MKETISTSEQTLILTLDNQFGILERVIGIFTLRGYSILLMTYQQDNEGYYNLKITINCNQTELEKLIKIIEKQIHVIKIEQINSEIQDFAGIA